MPAGVRFLCDCMLPYQHYVSQSTRTRHRRDHGRQPRRKYSGGNSIPVVDPLSVETQEVLYDNIDNRWADEGAMFDDPPYCDQDQGISDVSSVDSNSSTFDSDEEDNGLQTIYFSDEEEDDSGDDEDSFAELYKKESRPSTVKDQDLIRSLQGLSGQGLAQVNADM